MTTAYGLTVAESSPLAVMAPRWKQRLPREVAETDMENADDL